MHLLAVVAGFATGLGLIVAIGAQNAHLLRMSVQASRRTLAAAVAICAGSDAVLIVAGVLGIGVVVERFPVALLVARIVGAAFLIIYGVFAARRAIRPSGAGLVAEPESAPEPAAGRQRPSGRGAVLEAAPRAAAPARTALLVMVAFTWANPHVYLDTLLFLGSVANQQGPALRWWWVAGAVAASCVWFSAIGFGGRLLKPVLSRPTVWRALDGGIAVLMVALGAGLLLGL
ncbi:LysE/ArgO family amino acid transporter [Amnibacterium kyonggiense]|uniref:L-lysine exporter family protein LysE/ArgO n=1 Tax=Amnibacterium kyonggiense TaxID=595671 RepID=A0A4R7FJE0_9MICO|nr:LysE family transporter [Amnibacterium kyonggiense]TDS76194.1 L-lysine exporter family protein LysE/ArgO [Amnibacterium kyonggiense]